jgi:hypothetical protein
MIRSQFLQGNFPVGSQERTLIFGLSKGLFENRNRLYPSLKVLFHTPALSLQWQRTKNIDLRALVGKAINDRNGWLQRKFPECHKFVAQEKYDPKAFVSEFKTLIQDAIQLEWKTLPVSLLYYGPFYVGLLELREAFFGEFGINGLVDEITFVQIGSDYYMSLLLGEKSSQVAATKGKGQWQIMPLTTGAQTTLYRIDFRCQEMSECPATLQNATEKYVSFIKMAAAHRPTLPEIAFPEGRLFTMGEIIDFFDGAGEAYRTGLSRYPDRLFSIQEVDPEPVDLGFFSRVGG